MSAANGRNPDALVGLPPVLDACCGSRMFWFDHGDKRALPSGVAKIPLDLEAPGAGCLRASVRTEGITCSTGGAGDE